jgi:hypothetical protein
LLVPTNSEPLTDIVDSSDIDSLNSYVSDIYKVSVHFNDPLIIPNKSGEMLKVKKRVAKKASKI